MAFPYCRYKHRNGYLPCALKVQNESGRSIEAITSTTWFHMDTILLDHTLNVDSLRERYSSRRRHERAVKD
jgi:hypothetical protein